MARGDNSSLILLGLAGVAVYFLFVKNGTMPTGATCTVKQVGNTWYILRAAPGMAFTQVIQDYPTKEAADAACTAFLASANSATTG